MRIFQIILRGMDGYGGNVVKELRVFSNIREAEEAYKDDAPLSIKEWNGDT